MVLNVTTPVRCPGLLYTVPTRIIRTLENCVLLTIEGQWNGKFVIRVEGKAITTNRYGYPCKKNQN